jgi:hypothetical protein
MKPHFSNNEVVVDLHLTAPRRHLVKLSGVDVVNKGHLFNGKIYFSQRQTFTFTIRFEDLLLIIDPRCEEDRRLIVA